MHDLASLYNSNRTRTCLRCNEIIVLKWPGYSPEMNSIEKVWKIMKKDIGNQLPCLKAEMWQRVCEACSTERSGRI